MSVQPALAPIADAWGSFRDVAHVGHISNDGDYDHAIRITDALVEDGAMDGSHPQHSLFMLLADLIYAYDERQYPLPTIGGTDVLRFLMEQHNLTQSELPEIGRQSVVSEILSGRRRLTVDHIANLSRRFGIDPSAFF